MLNGGCVILNPEYVILNLIQNLFRAGLIQDLELYNESIFRLHSHK